MKPKMISEPVPPRLPFPSALLLVSYYIMVRIQREAWVQVLSFDAHQLSDLRQVLVSFSKPQFSHL